MRYLTDSERAALLAYVEFGNSALAAHRLGISESTLRNALHSARRKYDARNTAHLAALLFPALGEFYRLPCDE